MRLMEQQISASGRHIDMMQSGRADASPFAILTRLTGRTLI